MPVFWLLVAQIGGVVRAAGCSLPRARSSPSGDRRQRGGDGGLGGVDFGAATRVGVLGVAQSLLGRRQRRLGGGDRVRGRGRHGGSGGGEGAVPPQQARLSFQRGVDPARAGDDRKVADLLIRPPGLVSRMVRLKSASPAAIPSRARTSSLFEGGETLDAQAVRPSRPGFGSPQAPPARRSRSARCRRRSLDRGTAGSDQGLASSVEEEVRPK